MVRSNGSEHPRVLIADDEQDYRDMLSLLARRTGFEPLLAEDGASVLEIMRNEEPDVVLLDNKMPGMDGMAVLRESQRRGWAIPMIIVTAFGSIDSAVHAMKLGAFDYVTKPFCADELLQKIRRALAYFSQQPAHHGPRHEGPNGLNLAELMGPSRYVRKIIADVERVAATDFSVVIEGETGSGKELLAHALHRRSLRAGKPLLPVDCGAIQPSLVESELFGHEKGAFTGADRQHVGKFEAAAGGTLFLDEVQNLSLPVQVKFLRTLQEKQITRVGGRDSVHVDVRLLVATNQNLESLIKDDRFRRDLYHRINEFKIRLPALRERPDDIPYLARSFLAAACSELGKDEPKIAPSAERRLLDYAWPGNVRELRNVMRQAALIADLEIGSEHLRLSDQAAAPPPPDAAADDWKKADAPADNTPLKELVQQSVAVTERHAIVKVLRQTSGNQAEAARILQVDYKTLRTKIKLYGLSLSDAGRKKI